MSEQLWIEKQGYPWEILGFELSGQVAPIGIKSAV